MNDNDKKTLFAFILIFCSIILFTIGGTFAYFTASINSENEAISVGSAEFKIEFDDDTSLIKENLIPSLEDYVDITSRRVDANGNFLKPYVYDDVEHKENTACIDDNKNAICSIYTFTIGNPMTSIDLPLYIRLIPSINTFENLYFKVLDENLNEVIAATHIYDDRDYTLDEEENKIYDEDSKMSPVVLSNISKTIDKAIDENTPSIVKYSIVLWINEIGNPQNNEDSGKLFAAKIEINAGGPDGKGISGVISTHGTEKN